ncbi:MAG: ATP-binding protein [Candidatus Gastranaerophilales bacterium]|nr:ATP-binding protein [Candidatus Gastranaerophilales bacterium]
MMRQRELIVYRMKSEEASEEDRAKDGRLIWDMAELISSYEELLKDTGADQSALVRQEMAETLFGCIHELIEMAGTYGFHGNLWHCLLTLFLVNHENSYSLGCEMRDEAEGTIDEAVLHDLAIIQELFCYDFVPMCQALRAPEFLLTQNYVCSRRESKVYNQRICARICELAEKLGKDRTPWEMKSTLAQFYKEYGVGKFGLHKSFRVACDEKGNVKVEPILNIAHVRLDDLVGYEAAKGKLIENTEAFVSGRRANNCLLFGDAGTGKSSSIKAIANEYYPRGLRVIEIYRHQFPYLSQVISQIKQRNYRFIIYMDDLSFEAFETEYKYLKAVIEGGLEKKPENVLIYATSNRRHLIRENYSDKEEIREDMHTSDTVQEKLSLAYRFGVTIYFGAPDKKLFQEIVSTLARRHGIEMPEEELYLAANKWELAHGGLSGRTAQQFIDYLLGSQMGE